MNYTHMTVALGIKGFVKGKELRANCPLHNDSNPSFSVNIETGLWICHAGCGSGDFYDLVERIQGCSWQEASAWVNSNGKRAGVEQIMTELGNSLTNVLLTETDIDSKLWLEHYNSLNNSFMPQWFLDRGFTWATINHWDIRYEPATDGIVIPVLWRENLIGTIRRPLYGEPKYQNSFGLHKADILFGEISNRQNVIICEGVLDAIWLWQNGYNAVSLLGSSISDRQVVLLQNMRFGEIVLALDNDEAGKKGTNEALDKFIYHGWLLPQIRIMHFPNDKKDPNACNPEELANIFFNRKAATFELTT